ncbi:unnamed protein product [Periconia digitata]|uniref:Uncharacterized protein n=1 Tax=Periconia digitata TaxID=1303443 RepID=A0A9W4U8K6_9PLEO|nr:unnamed protein product [Periconia digitata]
MEVLKHADKIKFPVEKFGPCGANVYLWALVYLHRLITMKALPIPHSQLCCWLWQFGSHLLECYQKGPGVKIAKFQYDSSRLKEYEKHLKGSFDFQRLTWWVMNPHWAKTDANGVIVVNSIQPLDYAKMFDAAIQSQLDFLEEINKNSEKAIALWAEYKQKMERACKPPFSAT